MTGAVRLSPPIALDIKCVLRWLLCNNLFWTLHRERDDVLVNAHKVHGKNNTSFIETGL